jgi:hypothetical protein
LFLCTATVGCDRSETPAGETDKAAQDQQSTSLPMLAIPGKSSSGKTANPTQGKRPAKAAAPAKSSSAEPVDPDDDPEDVEADKEDLDDKDDPVAPKKGTPEALVHEATKLMLEAPPKTEDVAALKKHRKEKNEKIVELSKQAIARTHKDPDKERLLNLAVHNMMEARTQLALAGDTDNIELLNEDAAALYKRDPKSAAAAEAAHAQVNLAYGLARAAPAGDAKWLIEFATQARYLAENFPGEERRSLPLLFAAGRSCELPGLTKEALRCYVMIIKRFPDSPFAARVTPIARRLKLVGKPPKIAGPTIDGDQVNIDDMLGKVVLVVFWSSQAEPFQELLHQLLPVLRTRSRRGLQVMGVNLDQEPAAMQQFVIKHKISWPQIFFPETDRRGWNNPIASHYGIMDLPALWLVDKNGSVVSTSVKIEMLADEIDMLLGSEQR